MGRHLRRGISPLIATVLLILIAISTGLLIYAFATGWIGSRTSLGVGPSSSIAIDAAYLEKGSKSGCNVTVYIRNVGSVPTNITAIYVTEVATGDVYADMAINQRVDPGNVIKIEVNLTSLTPTSGYSYEVKAVTADGATAATTITYKGS